MGKDFTLSTPVQNPITTIEIDKIIVDYPVNRVSFWLNYKNNSVNVKSETREFDNFTVNQEFNRIVNTPLPNDITFGQALELIVAEELKKEFTILD